MILICICTRERDQMLAAAAAAVGRLARPEDYEVELLIVENETSPRQADVIKGFDIGMPLHYRHEPALGLVMARNRALETAIELGAQWVAFTDDDQEVEPDWLTAYQTALRANPQQKILTGPYWYKYPEDFSPYRRRQRDRAHAESVELNTIMGGNCLIHRDIFGPNGLNLRFNLIFNFTGCEDTEYGLRAAAAGFPFIWVKSAVVREALSGHRATYRDQWIRSMWIRSNIWRARRGLETRVQITLALLKSLDRAVVMGAWETLKGLGLFPFNKTEARICFGEAGLHMTSIAGIWLYALGKHPKGYATVRARP